MILVIFYLEVQSLISMNVFWYFPTIYILHKNVKVHLFQEGHKIRRNIPLSY